MDVSVLIELLVELGGLEDELVTARDARQRSEQRGSDLRELQSEYVQDAVDAAETDQSTQVSIRSRENEIRATEATLAAKRDRIVGISDRRQYRALQEEIAALEGRLDRLETEAIELLESSDVRARQAVDSADARDRQEDESRQELAELSRNRSQANAAETEILAEIERLQKMLPVKEGRLVERLRRSLPQAVVHISNGACGGCFGQLPPQQAIAADQAKAVVICPSCARFVVHRPWR